MADTDPTLIDKLREYLAKKNTNISSDVNDLAKADQVDTSSDTVKNYAEGGAVSDEEKRQMVMKAVADKSIKLDEGGAVPDPTLPPDAPQEDKLQAIMRAIGMAGSQAVAPLGLGGAPADALASGAAKAAQTPGIAPVVNSVMGTHIPEPAAPAPEAPAPVPVPPVAPTPAAPAVHAPHVAAPSAPAPEDPLAQMGKFDPSSVTPGMNPGDRQALAGNLDANQHTFGNYLAEALAGLGDAVAAKGGVQQNSLGNIFALQTQQRHEALENFDKARQMAVDHFNMKNQADQTLLANLKARGELQVAPGIAHALGHPELANRPVAQAELVLKTDAMKQEFTNKMQERKQNALKNSADEIDKALTHGGMFGTQKATDPKTRLNMIHAQAIRNDPEAFGYSITEHK